MKLAIFDLDGTLFDTKDVNYHAYKEALNNFGFDLDYDYFCKYCNGRYYKDFLNETVNDELVLEEIHEIKKNQYSKFISCAVPNNHLLSIAKLMKLDYSLAIVTTASRKNALEMLDYFNVRDLFELILTREDVTKSKPNPEGFLMAMNSFGVEKEDTIVFEDSEPGFMAAEKAGIQYVVIKGYN